MENSQKALWLEVCRTGKSGHVFLFCLQFLFFRIKKKLPVIPLQPSLEDFRVLRL